jgi:hypothetical protein
VEVDPVEAAFGIIEMALDKPTVTRAAPRRV